MKQAPTQPNTNPEKNKENINNQVFQNELLEARKRQKEKSLKLATSDGLLNIAEIFYLPDTFQVIYLPNNIREIADNAEKILKIRGFSDKFFHYMSEGFYSLASPVWSNFGKKRGLPVSCFGSNVADDMGNILYTQSEVGMMSKLGGGTSGYFGHIRHRGSAVKDNGEASGSVHIMQLFETMVDVVSQGSVRREIFTIPAR